VAVDLHQSLTALRTDYIDLYYLHRDDERVGVEEILGYLKDFVKAGKIRYFAAPTGNPPGSAKHWRSPRPGAGTALSPTS
jgi:aryl-alcohol dehydrogenase-like predicted oxidoreductase